MLLLAAATSASPAGTAPNAAPRPPPARIVSLTPSLTETVCALGGCDRLVGVDRYSNAPAQVATLPRLGGLDNAQVEAIVALRPQLVIASPSARVVGRLQALGIEVLALPTDSYADVRHALDAVAAALGTPAAGAAAWTRIEKRIDAAARRVPAGWSGRRVYVEVDDGPYAAGAASFIGQTLARLGLASVVPAALGAFPRLNPEFIVRAQPDLLVAGERGLAQMRRRPGWQALQALRDGRTCGFAADRFEALLRPGPRLGEGAEAIVDCLREVDARLARR